jgi:hypothetical protein
MVSWLLIQVARVLWMAAVLRWGVNTLRGPSDDKGAAAEFKTALVTVLALSLLGLVLGALCVLPIPGLALLCWVFQAAVWYAVFAVGYELGFLRALWMLPIQIGGALIFGFVVWLLPLGEAASSIW